MSRITVRALGTKKLLKQLKEYETRNVKEVHDLIRGAGFDMDTDAKKLAPVDTARLKASIHPEFKETGASFRYEDKQGTVFNGGLPSSPKNPLEVYLGTNVQYAPEQEDKHHFLLRAWEKGSKSFIRDIKREFKK